MTPAQCYACGVRILARTTLEAVRDPWEAALARMLREPLLRHRRVLCLALSIPFAGSCNGLFSILRHLPGAEGLGFEFEQAIFDMTTRNIATLNARIRLVHGDFRVVLGKHSYPPQSFIVHN